jgi:hypothetical protein
MNHSHTPLSVDARLERLESQLKVANTRARRYRYGMTTTLGCLGIFVLLGANDITRLDAIRTHRLEVLDAEGRVVLSAGTDAGGGRLDVWSPTGENLMRLGSNDHGGDLAVWNTDGVNVAGAWATDGGGSLAAWDGQGKRAVTLAGSEAGGTMTLETPDGHTKIVMQAAATPSIAFTDTQGHQRLTLGVDAIAFAAGTDDSDTLRLQPSDDGGNLIAGDTTLRLLALGGLDIQQGGQRVLRAQAIDGETALTLSAPHGTATIQAGVASAITLAGGTATLNLAGGDTESVMMASDPDAAIISTSDNALSLYASHGAGRMVLGNGESGQVRLTGGVDGLAAAVDVLAADGTRIATLSTTKGGMGLVAVSDQTGKPVALLHAAGPNRGRLSVHGPGGTAVADAAADGTPEFALMTPDGRTTAALAATVRGGALNLMNADGTPVVLAGITADGPGGAATFQNGEGLTVVAIGSTKANVGRVVVD